MLGVAGTILIGAGVIAANLDKMARQPDAGTVAAAAGGEEGRPLVVLTVGPGQAEWREGHGLVGGQVISSAAGPEWQGRLKAKTSFVVEMPGVDGEGQAAQLGDTRLSHRWVPVGQPPSTTAHSLQLLSAEPAVA